MPVLAKFCGIVIRLLMHRTFGTRLHAFYGNHELVIGLNPVRVIGGDAPLWVKQWALDWAQAHEGEFRTQWRLDPTLLGAPASKQARPAVLQP